METNVNYTIVGAFVIILFACIVMSIIWLSAGFSTDQYKTYEVYMRESVNGLSIDAPVEFNGVEVGEVKEIHISQKDPQIVILVLNVKSNTPVTMGTHAMLNMRGLTGLGYLALVDKGTDTRPLEKLPDQSYPIINTAPSLLVRFDTALTELNDSLHQVSVSVQSLLDKQNLRSIKQILQSMEQITLALPPLVQSSRSTMQLITTQTLPAANQAMANLDVITRNMASVSAEIKQNPAILIRGKQPQTLGPGEK